MELTYIKRKIEKSEKQVTMLIEEMSKIIDRNENKSCISSVVDSCYKARTALKLAQHEMFAANERCPNEKKPGH